MSIKVTSLPELTSPEDDDILLIVDTSAGTTKKISRTNLFVDPPINDGGLPVTALNNANKFNVGLTTGYTNSAGTFEPVPFDTRGGDAGPLVCYDPSSSVDVTTHKGRFTCQVPGDWDLRAAMNLSPGASTQHYILTLYKNGTEYARGSDFWQGLASPSSIGLLVAPPAIPLIIGDYVEVFFYSLLANTITGNIAPGPYFGGRLVST